MFERRHTAARRASAQPAGPVIWCAQIRVISHPGKFQNRGILRRNSLPKHFLPAAIQTLKLNTQVYDELCRRDLEFDGI